MPPTHTAEPTLSKTPLWLRGRSSDTQPLGPIKPKILTRRVKVLTPESSLESSSVEPQWHPYHSRGDITLRSEDGILFGADSWRLARASTAFSNMLEIPQPRYERDADQSTPRGGFSKVDPIDTEISSHVLNIFLNLINVSDPLLPEMPYPRLVKLAKFLKKFECNEDMTKMVVVKLRTAGDNAPWDSLVYAGQIGDTTLARRAIRSMGPQGFTKVRAIQPGTPLDEQLLSTKPFWTRMKMLPESWQLQLLTKTLQEPSQYLTGHSISPGQDVFSVRDRCFMVWRRISIHKSGLNISLYLHSSTTNHS